jgi:hypothetical protein
LEYNEEHHIADVKITAWSQTMNNMEDGETILTPIVLGGGGIMLALLYRVNQGYLVG